MDALERIGEELLENSAALAVMVLDASWHELARAGAATLLDAQTLASLRSAERESCRPLDGRHVHLSVSDRHVLVVLFDDRTSLGLVRLRAKKALAQLTNGR